jgi:hypothetical protein
MVEADEYQMQNAKNFKYRYYPPRLVELQDGSMVPEGSKAYAAAATAGGKARGGNSWSGYGIWIIIIVVVVLTCFLMLGILYMDTTKKLNNSYY